MALLLGEHLYKVGQKHRLALPKKFREILGEQAVVTRGYEGCLVVVSTESWHAVMAEVENGSFLDQDVRSTARFLLGGAEEVFFDQQGRFIVPSVLYEYAELNDEVVFVGLGRWVEIWSKDRWMTQQQQLAQQGAAIAQRFQKGNDHV